MKNEGPTHLDLFSGIGGFALAAQWAGFRTIGFCEIDKYCQKVLAKNFVADTASCNGRRRSKEGWVSETIGARSQTPIIGNIFELDGRDFFGVTLITGGFPCQPFSVAGKRRGAADDRHLWPEMLRIIKEARPAWVLGENVPGIIPMELDNVLSDLESVGYATRPFVIPACAVDARHRRDRLWIIAADVSDTERDGLSRSSQRRSFVEAAGEKSAWSQHALYAAGTGCLPTSDRNVFDASGRRREQCESERESSGGACVTNQENGTEWLAEPSMGRVANGIPCRVDRLKGLGNAIVPQVAYEILREIRKLC